MLGAWHPWALAMCRFLYLTLTSVCFLYPAARASETQGIRNRERKACPYQTSTWQTGYIQSSLGACLACLHCKTIRKCGPQALLTNRVVIRTQAHDRDAVRRPVGNGYALAQPAARHPEHFIIVGKHKRSSAKC